MSPRQKLQCSYELAFYPPLLHCVSRRICKIDEIGIETLRECLDKALLLHKALPEYGYSSQRALERLAVYQAKARAFGVVTLICNLRTKLNCKPLLQTTVPGELVRDIGLPELSQKGFNKSSKSILL